MYFLNLGVKGLTACRFSPRQLPVVLQIDTKLRVINIKIPLQPHKKHDITQYGELDFS